MSYEVGAQIDLRHLNHKSKAAPSIQKKSNVQEAANTLYEVGTQFIFNLTSQKSKVARRIQVVYA